jgi:Uma2 family endonuclease
MATGALVSVAEYLSSSYRPDRDYVDGVILERNLGEYDHGRLQLLLATYLVLREQEWRIRAVTEVRVQVSPTRFRIPDVLVMRAEAPVEQIVTTAPFICIEILSEEDRMERMQDRIDDYLTMGVPHVWVINPRSRRAFVYTTEGSHEAKDGILRTENPELVVPLAEVFESIV